MSLGSYMCLNFWISSFTVEHLSVVSLTLSLSYRDKMWSAATTEQHPGWFLWFEGEKTKQCTSRTWVNAFWSWSPIVTVMQPAQKNDRHSNTAMSSSSFLSFFFFFLQLTVLLLLLLLGLCCKTGGGNIILIVRLSEWERRSKSQYFFLFILTYDEADLKMSISRFIWNGCYAAHKMLCLVIDHVVGV